MKDEISLSYLTHFLIELAIHMLLWKVKISAYSTLIFPTFLNHNILFYVFRTTLLIRILLFRILQFFWILLAFFYFAHFFFPIKFLP